MRGHQKRNIGRHQRQRDFDARIARPAPQAQAKPADGNAIGNFADDDQNKCSGGLAEREETGRDCSNRKAVEDQGRGIVGHSFAVKHDNEPAGDAELPHDRQWRQHVWRRHDGAEHEGDADRHAEQPVRQHRHGAGREDDASDRQKGNRAQVELKLAPTHGC
jgi:hypothetical protein